MDLVKDEPDNRAVGHHKFVRKRLQPQRQVSPAAMRLGCIVIALQPCARPQYFAETPAGFSARFKPTWPPYVVTLFWPIALVKAA